ncbi:YceD family protein [Thiomonas sp.]|uniref:YceD family protein n=1 Tax=Thiomonas sp. TaxID=2047785 RepID=UPI00258D16FB|nr:YceD family protein [Thiomonas sp.]
MSNYTGLMMENTPAQPEPSSALRLNLRTLAQEQGVVEGRLALNELPRLESFLAGAPESSYVDWRLRGFMRNQAGGQPQPMVELQIQAELPMLCQRCLQPAMQKILDVALFRLVEDEPELTLEELEAEDEALCLQGLTDARALVEDQVLLALPLVPMHDVCPQPIVAEGLWNEPAAMRERPSPFAVLAKLKKPG